MTHFRVTTLQFIYLFNIKIVHIVHNNTKEKANEMKKSEKNTQKIHKNTIVFAVSVVFNISLCVFC